MPYFAYILKSVRDQKYYYGHSSNPENRLAQHNQGKVKSTKSRRPLVIHYYEEFTTKAAAARRELFFKTIEGYLYLKQRGII